MRLVGSKLTDIIRALARQHGNVSPPPARTAFELVVWEKVAYLVSDERRQEAFELLERRVGLTPRAILAASRATVVDVLATGGIGAPQRANNLIEAAQFAVAESGGSLDEACSAPLPEAKKHLKRIPGIADPGAEKILLLTRKHPVLGLDSNGLRVLQRLGYGTAAKSYAAAYRSATEAALPELGKDIDRLIEANLLLRRHGQTICKTSAPKCGACSVRARCPSAPGSSSRRVRPS